MGIDSAAVEVVRSVSMPLSQVQTFKLFTTRMTDFWPTEYSIGSPKIAEVVIEPCSGGRWFERGIDGSDCLWGRVASWDPPREVMLLWEIGADWQYDPDFRTEVKVSFTLKGPGTLDWICGTAICSAMETTPSRCGRSSMIRPDGRASWPASSIFFPPIARLLLARKNTP